MKVWYMYLVVVVVDTPDWCADADQLRVALRTSVAAIDQLEHVYLETDDGQARLSLYLKAADRAAAIRLAEQLSRRTMAAVCASKQWRLSFIKTL